MNEGGNNEGIRRVKRTVDCGMVKDKKVQRNRKEWNRDGKGHERPYGECVAILVLREIGRYG